MVSMDMKGTLNELVMLLLIYQDMLFYFLEIRYLVSTW